MFPFEAEHLQEGEPIALIQDMIKEKTKSSNWTKDISKMQKSDHTQI